MSKCFSDTWNDITNNVSVNSKGKKVISHSRTDFDTLTKSLLNDVAYETTRAKVVNGTVVVENFKPTEDLRKGMVKSLLRKAGHDAAEAEKLAMEIEIDNVSGLYEFISEDLYQYMKAGKKFNFVQKEDFVGSIQIDSIEERDVEYKDMTTRVPMVSHQGAYDKLVSSSTCPSNKKGKPKEVKASKVA